MKKINILIIEDNINEANLLKSHLESLSYTIVGIASNLKDALGVYFSEEIDLVIIDVFLNNQPDGIVFVEKINEQTKNIKPFIFLTSSMDRAVFERAKITQPYSFLLKPFNKNEIAYTIELALEKHMFESETNTDCISSFFVKKKDVFFKVPLIDVYCIEVEDRYSKISTKNGDFLIQSSLFDLHKKLPVDIFSRIHRNYVINQNEIKEIHAKDNLIVLNNNLQISIGRSYKKDFLNNFNILK